MSQNDKPFVPDRPSSVLEASAVHATVYSNFFLVGETWYCTIECEKCGRVDEAIHWDTAKTPRHAALVAEDRHAACRSAVDEEIAAEARVREIKAAEDLRDQQARNLLAAMARAATWEAVCKVDPDDRMKAAQLDTARALLKRHEKGMLEAEKRVQNTLADNLK